MEKVLIGLREPLWVMDDDGFTALDEMLDKGMDFYRSYLKNAKSFDYRNTAAVCGGAGCAAAPLTIDEVTAYNLYYLRQQRSFVEGSAPVRTLHPVVV